MGVGAVVESDFQTFEAIGALVFVLDPDGRIVYWNRACADSSGYSLEAARGRRLGDFLLVPAEIEPVMTVFATLRATGRPSRFVSWWLTKTGERRLIAWSSTMTKGPEGQPGYLLTTGLERTESEQAEARDRELLAELGAALADTVDYGETLTRIASLVVRDLADFCLVDLIDRDGTLRRMKVLHRDPANTALCEAFRRLPVEGPHAPIVFSVVESKRSRLISAVSPQYLESVARDHEHLRTLRGLAPRSLMVVPLLARGSLLGALVLVSSHPSRCYGDADLRLAEKVASRAALAIENASLFEDARSLTTDLREANQQMVNATIRAQELTEEAEAANARTAESERELREVGEFRERFIGIVGHDLRTPLTSIGLTALSLLRHGHLDEQATKRVDRIISSTERMTKMISQLLDLTRARLGGGFSFEPIPTDLRKVFQGVVEEFEAPIQLEVEGDMTGTWDADRLAEALSNIAGNAVEHAFPGTPVVVKARGEGPDVVVEVSNQGDPIPEDVLPFIFEPFRRARKHEKKSGGNLGLGLYIARQIVRSGSGTLVAYSTDGKTTFSMRLPRHAPSPTPPPPALNGQER
jgi:PAS domain S-box-containing protein